MSRAILWLLALTLVFGIAQTVSATPESICPSGSGPRSDIVGCFDYDTLGNCTTGQEGACWTDNGYAGGSPGTGDYTLKIKGDGGAVGNGYVTVKARQGSSIGGTYVINNYLDASNTQEFTFRWYMKFGGSWLAWPGHGIQADAIDPNQANCSSTIKLQLSNWTMEAHDPAGCAGGHSGGFGFVPNQGVTPTVRTGRWYLLEMYAKIDTACSDPTVWNACDGIYKLWVDGVLIAHHTNINFNGVASGGDMRWSRVFLPQSYFHQDAPPWEPSLYWDNFVVSDCSSSACTGAGPYIGAASSENDRGTADTSSPYRLLSRGSDAFIGRHIAPDCAFGGMGKWRTAGNTELQSSVIHTLFVSSPLCQKTVAQLPSLVTPSVVNSLIEVTDLTSTTDGDLCVGGGGNTKRCAWDGSVFRVSSATDMAVKVTLSSSSQGGGVFWERGALSSGGLSWLTIPQYVIYGWMRLPASNNYTVTNLALSGFYEAFGNPANGYVAMTVTGGEGAEKWAVVEHNTAGSFNTHATTTSVTFDTWVEYEIILFNDNTVTLSIDRVKLFDREAMTLNPAGWMFGGGNPGMVGGVIDFVGTAPFEAYIDDHVVSSVSAWSCDGWGAASCPFTDANIFDVNVTVSGNGNVTGTGGIDCPDGGACTGVYFAGNTVTLTAVADPGSVFVGWSGGVCSGTGTCVVTDESNVIATFDDGWPETLTIRVQ